jgi:hypothetical protein
MMYEHILILKRAPLRPDWRKDFNASVGGHRDPGPMTHPDLPGVVFPSVGSLKKAYRIQRYAKNSLSKKNNHRLEVALRNIFNANGINMPAMVKTLITERVASMTMPSAPSLNGVIERIIREEAIKVIGSKDSLTRTIRDIVTTETRRLVLDSLSLDFKVTGEAFTRPDKVRALRLE